MRAIGPVDEDPDHGIFYLSKLADGLVGLGDEAVDEPRLAPEKLQGPHQVPRGLAHLRQRPLIRLCPIVAGKEDRYIFRQGSPFNCALAR